MSSPTHTPAPVRHAVGLVLGLVLLVGVACSSPSASENPPSEPNAASTQPSEAPAVDDGEEWIVRNVLVFRSLEQCRCRGV